ncbi:MAG: inositol monophosphatase family protein [Saprospiraceae bacterium]
MLQQLCTQACEIVSEVAEFIAAEAGKVSADQIETKSLNSLVSYVDKTAETMLVSELGKLLPGSVFLTEEETVEQATGEWQWIIDPLDGTTNFLHGLPCFAVSVALRQNEETVMGIVYEVTRKECFYAWKGGGSWLNGVRISVTQTASLADSLLATGFPYRDFERLKPYLQVFTTLMKSTRGIRRFGAAAVDLAWVACGRFDAFYEYGLSPWDLAAGALLVQEAGGKVSDFRGGDDYLFGEELIAANAQLHQPVLDVIKQAFYPS